MWIVYMVECADTSLSTVTTKNLEQRMNALVTGKGARYTKSRGPVTPCYTEIMDSKGAAITLETAIKITG